MPEKSYDGDKEISVIVKASFIFASDSSTS